MSKVLQQLQRQRADYLQQINEAKDCLRDLDLAIAAIKGTVEGGGDVASARPKFRITEAIELAIKAGCGTPAEIHGYLERELSVLTTRATISSTLSRMRDTHDIYRDGTRWIFRGPLENSSKQVSSTSGQSHANGVATNTPE